MSRVNLKRTAEVHTCRIICNSDYLIECFNFLHGAEAQQPCYSEGDGNDWYETNSEGGDSEEPHFLVVSAVFGWKTTTRMTYFLISHCMPD